MFASTPDQRPAMAIKAFFALALVLSVAIGLLIPTPGAGRPQAKTSAFQTIELRHS
ncbi:hypothetical protein [Caulobacter sp.]|uniref:hypothetical protein n=1 Tax=Caulobacter sp. TaxID=78 RepID=UPI003BA84A63